MKKPSKKTLALCLVNLAVLAFASSCAHQGIQKGQDPELLLERACFPGKDIKSIKGSVWLKAKAKDASGQFPASVLAETPASLRVEVTNLIGGLEAVITIKDQKYTIETPKQKRATERGTGSWGGIPLLWATELFLGRIPCPPASNLKEASINTDPEGNLIVETKSSLAGEAESFKYRFRQWAGAPWPESLHWEKKGPLGNSIDFKFDDPEDKTGSPRRWEAKSPQGEVKVRWRDRDVVR